MATPHAQPAGPAKSSPWLVIAGVLVGAGWLIVAFIVGSLMLMASLMANDSGAVSTDRHMGLIIGVIAGQVLAAFAGVPAGLAFFCRGRRRLMIGLFAGMLVAGILTTGISMQTFFAAAGQ